MKLWDKLITPVIVLAVLALVATLAVFATPNEDGTRTYDGGAPEYSDTMEKAYCEARESNDRAVAALSGIDVPQDATSNCEPTDLPQMGSLTYYKTDVSTPDAFVRNMTGKGFNEGYGLQCVAGFKQFTYALSGKYVAAAGGGAKGYATQQRQIEPLGFKWHSGTAGLQNGDWAIWTNGQYGHVAMYFNGQWFGQNQYAANPNAGNAFNLASISTNGIAGYYRPNIYINQKPTPPPVKPPVSGGGNVEQVAGTHVVQSGDTLGGIALKNGWYGSVNGLYGDSGYTQRLAEFNGVSIRGLIYPKQVIKRLE